MSKDLLNQLNGLKPGEAAFTRQTQAIAEDKTVSLDLGSLLLRDEAVQSLGFGKKAVAKKVNVDVLAGKVHVSYSVGEVTTEGNEALAGSLHELVTKGAPAAAE